jgi:hypothetical protein
MATEHNQNTKSMDSLESKASNAIANDTDRKNSSEDTKCEITTDEHQNEMQIKREWEIKCYKGKKSIKELSIEEWEWEIKCFCKGKKSIEELSIEELSIEELEKKSLQCQKSLLFDLSPVKIVKRTHQD